MSENNYFQAAQTCRFNKSYLHSEDVLHAEDVQGETIRASVGKPEAWWLFCKSNISAYTGGFFESGESQFGDPVVTHFDNGYVFVEGEIGISRTLQFLPLFGSTLGTDLFGSVIDQNGPTDGY